MAFAAYPFLIDRETGLATFSFSYFIPAYIDPETGEVFDLTSWNLAFVHVGVSSGSTFDTASEGALINFDINLLGGNDINRYRLDFTAQNTFSAVSISESWNLIIAAYAAIDLTLTGGNDVDIIIGGTANDLLQGLDGNDVLDGGEGSDTLEGGAGADKLNGDLGDDTMSGGAGDDLYYVNSSDDLVIELNNEGDDTVMASSGFVLSDNVERLTLVGDGNTVGTGNSGDNIITGNDGLNILSGMDGGDVMDGGGSDDQLFGGAGNDMLIGGLGFDRLEGGIGDDIYVIDKFDLVTEASDEGDDWVLTGADIASYTLGANLEGLFTLSNAAFHGVGNIENNHIGGANGDDFLQGMAGDDLLEGSFGNDRLEGGVGADTLIGGGGDDTAIYTDSATAVQINLAVALQSGGDAEQDFLNGIENVVGSAHADTLSGDSIDNVLDGGDGDDTINGSDGNDVVIGGRGADILDGGAGKDALDYSTSVDLVIDLSLNTVSGGNADGDTIVNFEDVYGTATADLITGNAQANELRGGGGNDVIYGGDGNDIIMGGAGGDWLDGEGGVNMLSYAGADLGVLVDLAAMVTAGGQAHGDRIFNFDNVKGGRGNDALYGNESGNKLNGGIGNDMLYGRGGDDVLQGGAGADIISGGGGKDTASYASSTDGVTVDLATGLGARGDAAGDVLTSIENLEGGQGMDILRGNALNNRISGGSDHDFLDGAAGFDTLIGGAGNDTFRFHTGFDRDTINDFTHGQDQIFIDFDGGFTDWSQVMSFATATGPGGAHTVFNFGGGDELVVLNMRPQDFTASDFTPFS